ncbi:MAG TPA: hypothetical protein VJ570_11125 [Holophagaceae bacterium]|nr:hypothetical protein [Holophagaceae bacterium]
MPLTRVWKRRILLVLWPLGLLFGLKLGMRYGPGIPELWNAAKDSMGMKAAPAKRGPAVWAWHAGLLIQAELGFPRRLEGYLPAPEPDSVAHMQLMGMGLWDGKAWTDKALALGVAEGRGLRPRMGRLVLARVGEASPSRDYNGPELCQVDYWVAWQVEDEVRELLRVGQLVGLRRPEGLSVEAPGGEADQQLTLERSGFGWRVWKPETLQGATPGRPSRSRAWMTFFL